MEILLTMQHIERFAIMLRARHVIIGSIKKEILHKRRIECNRRLMYVFSNHISDRSNGISYFINKSENVKPFLFYTSGKRILVYEV